MSLTRFALSVDSCYYEVPRSGFESVFFCLFSMQSLLQFEITALHILYKSSLKIVLGRRGEKPGLLFRKLVSDSESLEKK